MSKATDFWSGERLTALAKARHFRAVEKSAAPLHGNAMLDWHYRSTARSSRAFAVKNAMAARSVLRALLS